MSMPLFNEGFRPAVDVGLSVSRVGSRVQWKAMKSVAKSLRIEFIQFKELLRVSKLQTGGQSDEMRSKLDQGRILQALLTQPAGCPVKMEVQIITFFSKNESILNELDKAQIQEFQTGIEAFCVKKDPTLFKLMREYRDVTDEIKRRIREVATAYVRDIKGRAPVEEDEVEVA